LIPERAVLCFIYPGVLESEMKFPFRIVSRSRYEVLRLAPTGARLLDGIRQLQNLEKRQDPIFCHASLAALPPQGEFAIIDVGANEGSVSLTFASLFPKAKIYAIEAEPNTCQRLAERVARSPSIHPVNVAVHTQPGAINFHSNKFSTLSSVRDLPDARADATPIQIQAKTLDGLLEDLRVENVGVLKVDTEGNDLEVLKSAEKLLQSPSLKYVICEFGIHPLDQRHVHLNDFLSFLGQRDFYLATTGDYGCHVEYLRGNGLFVRKGASEAR
jgi:FkbM family methyltransferase